MDYRTTENSFASFRESLLSSKNNKTLGIITAENGTNELQPYDTNYGEIYKKITYSFQNRTSFNFRSLNIKHNRVIREPDVYNQRGRSLEPLNKQVEFARSQQRSRSLNDRFSQRKSLIDAHNRYSTGTSCCLVNHLDRYYSVREQNTNNTQTNDLKHSPSCKYFSLLPPASSAMAVSEDFSQSDLYELELLLNYLKQSVDGEQNLTPVQCQKREWNDAVNKKICLYRGQNNSLLDTALNAGYNEIKLNDFICKKQTASKCINNFDCSEIIDNDINENLCRLFENLNCTVTTKPPLQKSKLVPSTLENFNSYKVKTNKYLQCPIDESSSHLMIKTNDNSSPAKYPIINTNVVNSQINDNKSFTKEKKHFVFEKISQIKPGGKEIVDEKHLSRLSRTREIKAKMEISDFLKMPESNDFTLTKSKSFNMRNIKEISLSLFNLLKQNKRKTKNEVISKNKEKITTGSTNQSKEINLTINPNIHCNLKKENNCKIDKRKLDKLSATTNLETSGNKQETDTAELSQTMKVLQQHLQSKECSLILPKQFSENLEIFSPECRNNNKQTLEPQLHEINKYNPTTMSLNPVLQLLDIPALLQLPTIRKLNRYYVSINRLRFAHFIIIIISLLYILYKANIRLFLYFYLLLNN